MEFNLFDKAKQDQQRLKQGNMLTSKNKPVAPAKGNALMRSSQPKSSLPSMTQKASMSQLIAQGQSRYAAQEADSIVKATQEDPMAFDYDYHYDKQKEAENRARDQREARKAEEKGQKPKSRYLAQLQKANERREVEKSAAWERMEAKANEKDGQVSKTESFVTSSYIKQLEIQKEGQLITAVEEELNKKKTANAKTGMTGFYTNYLGKVRGIQGEAVDPEAVVPSDEKAPTNQPKDFRGRMEDKLKELKQRQAEKEEEQLSRDKLHADDTFVNPTSKPRRQERRSRSRSRSQEKEESKQLQSDAKQAKLDKLKALQSRFKHRQANKVEEPVDDNSD